MIWAQDRQSTSSLTQFMEIANSTNVNDLGGKLLKLVEIEILDALYDFRAECTPPGPLLLLIITMVWGDPARRGVRRSAFPTFQEKIIEMH